MIATSFGQCMLFAFGESSRFPTKLIPGKRRLGTKSHVGVVAFYTNCTRPERSAEKAGGRRGDTTPLLLTKPEGLRDLASYQVSRSRLFFLFPCNAHCFFRGELWIPTLYYIKCLSFYTRRAPFQSAVNHSERLATTQHST